MKPALPKGTRDFGPEQVAKRNYIFGIIRSVFERGGYLPLETPVMENLSTLSGKYGDEGDMLLFKVLNNGDFLKDVPEGMLSQKNSKSIIPEISKRGLRYDLTVPFARYVVMHRNELAFPFKRYQIQPVWRADRPQKGRFQEFYQCDADVIGSTSLMYEAELLTMYAEVFRQLQLPVQIRLNNRKILQGLARIGGMEERFSTLVTILDKWDKIGEGGVRDECQRADLPAAGVETILQLLSMHEISQLRIALTMDTIAAKGLEEIDEVFRYLHTQPGMENIQWDPLLARGLAYYTGCIFEVILPDSGMGSLGGGGRYDDLTGIFDMPGVSGVGISFGAERIFDILEERKLFPPIVGKGLQLFLVALDEESHLLCYQWMQEWRRAGFRVDLYPKADKIQKMMKYANEMKAPLVGIMGATERAQHAVNLKDMHSGNQQSVPLTNVKEMLKTSE